MLDCNLHKRVYIAYNVTQRKRRYNNNMLSPPIELLNNSLQSLSRPLVDAGPHPRQYQGMKLLRRVFLQNDTNTHHHGNFMALRL